VPHPTHEGGCSSAAATAEMGEIHPGPGTMDATTVAATTVARVTMVVLRRMGGVTFPILSAVVVIASHGLTIRFGLVSIRDYNCDLHPS
jgi:hypothetical protein